MPVLDIVRATTGIQELMSGYYRHCHDSKCSESKGETHLAKGLNDYIGNPVDQELSASGFGKMGSKSRVDWRIQMSTLSIYHGKTVLAGLSRQGVGCRTSKIIAVTGAAS